MLTIFFVLFYCIVLLNLASIKKMVHDEYKNQEIPHANQK